MVAAFLSMLIAVAQAPASPGAGAAPPTAAEALPAEASIPESLGKYMPTEKRHMSPHFVVVSDAPPDAIANTINALERTRESVLKDLAARGLSPTDAGGRHLALLFSDEDRFRAFAREVDGQTLTTTLGYYQPSGRRLQLFDPESTDAVRAADAAIAKNEATIKAQQEAVNRMRARTGSRQEAALAQQQVDRARAVLASQRAKRDATIDASLRVVVVHEATHQVLFESGVQAAKGMSPLWLAEGLAVAYETADVRQPGGPASMRDERFAAFRAAVTANALIPVRVLVAARVLPSGDGIRDARRMQEDFYAQACMFTRWCMIARPAEFAALLRACRSATPADSQESVFESCFGSIDAVQRAYVLWLRDQMQEVDRTDAWKAVREWSSGGAPASTPAPGG